MSLVKLFIQVSLFLSMGFLLISCGMPTKVVQYDDFSGDVNQPIIFANGWGQDFNYPITVDISTSINSENASLVTYIQNAVDTWNNAIGRTILTLRTGTVTKTGNDFKGLFLPLLEAYHALYYDQISGGSGGWTSNTGKPSTTIATTIYSSKQNTISNASIRFNRDTYYFGETTTDYNTSTQYVADMESIALHELGHLLGLGHATTETNSAMYPTISVGHSTVGSPTYVRCVSLNDIDRIRSIYTGGTASTACVNP